ncbi:MAG: hypothetical protein N2444_04925 [Methylocystis sp.]|nr:hypothetical protein [Methylocystis sp.]
MRFLFALVGLLFSATVAVADGPDFAASSYGLVTSAKIANAASLSEAVDLGVTRLSAIKMDAAWTAANLTFQASHDCVNYANLRDETGAEVSVTAAAGNFIAISTPAKWLGVRCLKIRSGTSAAPVAQGALRTLTIIGAQTPSQ